MIDFISSVLIYFFPYIKTINKILKKMLGLAKALDKVPNPSLFVLIKLKIVKLCTCTEIFSTKCTMLR